ncbi:MAG: ribosomal RNA small subunit methyltransferase A [Planctomycetes bacterium]|nr:ribosomal RNA small subunit methyltransferase A [Planctomycetota bacterium]
MTAGRAPVNKSELIELFRSIGFRPSPRRGQNFLIDPNMRRAIVDAADLDESDVVLEIGPGVGALTELLCERAGAVVAVELDRTLFEILEEHLIDAPNLTLIQGDAVAKHHDIHPEVVQVLRQRLTDSPKRRLKVVSNLPYSASTPAIVALMTGNLPVGGMVLTVQKEIADRITGRPGTKDYGLLSVTVQAGAEVHVLRKLPPDVFWPRPKVSSAVIDIRPKAERGKRIRDAKTFANTAHILFTHRRKTVSNCFKSAGPFDLGVDAARLLEQCGIDPNTRGETLTVGQIIHLANTAFEWKSK